MPDHADTARLERGAGLPGREQILDHREQLLLRRVPRLQQVVIERHLVDRLDRRLSVGVRRQQHALGLRHQLPRLHEIVGPRQAGHPLVSDQQRDLLAPGANLLEEIEPLGTRTGAHHPIALTKAAPQITRDRRQHRRLIIDRNDRRTRRSPVPLIGVYRAR